MARVVSECVATPRWFYPAAIWLVTKMVLVSWHVVGKRPAIHFRDWAAGVIAGHCYRYRWQ